MGDGLAAVEAGAVGTAGEAGADDRGRAGDLPGPGVRLQGDAGRHVAAAEARARRAGFRWRKACRFLYSWKPLTRWRRRPGAGVDGGAGLPLADVGGVRRRLGEVEGDAACRIGRLAGPIPNSV